MIIVVGAGKYAKLQNTQINGDLIVNGENGEGGTLTLENVVVSGSGGTDGKIVVNEMGPSSLHLNSTTASTVMLSTDSDTRVVTNGESVIGLLDVTPDQKAAVELEGDFQTTAVDVRQPAQVVVKGYIEQMSVEASNTDVILTPAGNVGSLGLAVTAANVQAAGGLAEAAAAIGNMEGTIPQDLAAVKQKVDQYQQEIAAVKSAVDQLEQYDSNIMRYLLEYVRLGAQCRDIIEDPDLGLQFNLEYQSFHLLDKIRIAVELKHTLDYRTHNTKQQLQQALDTAIDQTVVFREARKYRGYFFSPTFGVIISNLVSAGSDVTDMVLGLEEGETKDPEVALEILGAYPSEGGLLEVQQVNGEPVIVLKERNTSGQMRMDEGANVKFAVDGRGTSTNLIVFVEPDNLCFPEVRSSWASEVQLDDQAVVDFTVKYPEVTQGEPEASLTEKLQVYFDVPSGGDKPSSVEVIIDGETVGTVTSADMTSLTAAGSYQYCSFYINDIIGYTAPSLLDRSGGTVNVTLKFTAVEKLGGVIRTRLYIYADDGSNTKQIGSHHHVTAIK